MSAPPAVVVRFELEAAARVFVDALDEGERVRLEDWLDAHPRESELVRLALELADERRAA